MSLDIFRDLGIVARYGSASIAGVCSEWYAFEICSLASAYLGPTSQASIAIMMTVMGCMWTFPSSLGTATAIRVGNLLGEGRPKTAKTSARAAQYGVGLLMLVQCSLLFLLRTAIGRLYSHDESVITIVNATMWIVCLVAYFDGIQGSLAGVLRGRRGYTKFAECGNACDSSSLSISTQPKVSISGMSRLA
ncbi:ethionine resistance protein [Cystobasidiomycetes sp. EMM_F5]